MKKFEFGMTVPVSTSFSCTALLVSMLNVITEGGDFTLMIGKEGGAIDKDKKGPTMGVNLQNWFYGAPKKAGGEREKGAIEYLGHFLDAR